MAMLLKSFKRRSIICRAHRPCCMRRSDRALRSAPRWPPSLFEDRLVCRLRVIRVATPMVLGFKMKTSINLVSKRNKKSLTDGFHKALNWYFMFENPENYFYSIVESFVTVFGSLGLFSQATFNGEICLGWLIPHREASLGNVLVPPENFVKSCACVSFCAA